MLKHKELIKSIKIEKNKFIEFEVQGKYTYGITLISLIITILILIILAGVAINLSLGNNGIFVRAKQARDLYINLQIAEQREINELEEQLTNMEFSGTTNVPVTPEEPITPSGDLLSEQITENNYGDFINYPIDLNNDGDTTNDWRIFYKEKSETSEYCGDIYIIASDYLPIEKLPTTIGVTMEEPYQAYWKSTPTLQTDWEKNRVLFKETKYNLDSKYKSSCSTSTLLNTKNWESFVYNNYADYAIRRAYNRYVVREYDAKRRILAFKDRNK